MKMPNEIQFSIPRPIWLILNKYESKKKKRLQIALLKILFEDSKFLNFSENSKL